MTDLLLINPGGFRKRVYQALSNDYSAIEPPFWAALTAAFIRNKGFSVDILDANAENLTPEETAEKINIINPKIINIVAYGQHPSASTQLMSVVGELCSQIKSKNQDLKIILTGIHPSSLPEKTLKEEQTDYVAEGEGFYTILDLLYNKPLYQITGLWYKSNNQILHNLRSPNIQDLDKELPDVAWDLLPMDKYKAHNWHCLNDLESRHKYAAISTSLGCPFSCTFCCINAPFGTSGYRTWSTDWVIRQLDILVNKYNVKNLKIIDELFILKPGHFLPLAEAIIEKNYDLNIWVYARVDTIREEYLDTLKKAGINWFGIGVESGDEKIRKEVSKGKFEDGDIREILKMVRRHGIKVAANYIFGLSEDNLESMKKTLDMALEINSEWANFYCATAYPGSKLYIESINSHTPLPEKWEDFGQLAYSFFPLPTKTLTPEQVLAFRDKAFDIYFQNPNYLNIIEQTFNKQAREHIEEMTKIKLKRKILEQPIVN